VCVVIYSTERFATYSTNSK